MSIADLVRPDLRQFSGYLSARKQNSGGDIWLNANESAYAQEFDTQQLNRYPEPQPSQLKQAICNYYQAPSDGLLITRGSDEAIDLLIRALCIPGKDSIVVQSPTFGMYAVCARLHACAVYDNPLKIDGNAFAWDIDQIISTVNSKQSKIVFICSPANPTGQSFSVSEIIPLLRALEDKCLVVIDEAYAEYSQHPSVIDLIPQFPHLAVLRTLSKAHALAGARIGSVIAHPELIALLKACQAPYPISKPSSELALQAFSETALIRTQQQILEAVAQRRWLSEKLAEFRCVKRVFQSEANFILVQFENTEQIYRTLLSEGIIVRSMAQYPAIQDCLRISVGTPAENARLLQTLKASQSP